MSWYFFGGFSAYAMVPSGRVVNHSGCSVTHGWSGRALQRQVQRDLQARARAAGGDEAAEVGRRTQLGVDRVVPALGRADRPRRADVVGPGGQRVVAALAVDPADRVDRRQVEHVEAHRRDAGQPVGGGGEGAVTRRARRRGRPRPPPSGGRTRTRRRRAPAGGRPRAGACAPVVTSSRTGCSQSRSARSSAGATRSGQRPVARRAARPPPRAPAAASGGRDQVRGRGRAPARRRPGRWPVRRRPGRRRSSW